MERTFKCIFLLKNISAFAVLFAMVYYIVLFKCKATCTMHCTYAVYIHKLMR